jgi:hypothetical protein
MHGIGGCASVSDCPVLSWYAPYCLVNDIALIFSHAEDDRVTVPRANGERRSSCRQREPNPITANNRPFAYPPPTMMMRGKHTHMYVSCGARAHTNRLLFSLSSLPLASATNIRNQMKLLVAPTPFLLAGSTLAVLALLLPSSPVRALDDQYKYRYWQIYALQLALPGSWDVQWVQFFSSPDCQPQTKIDATAGIPFNSGYVDWNPDYAPQNAFVEPEYGAAAPTAAAISTLVLSFRRPPSSAA